MKPRVFWHPGLTRSVVIGEAAITTMYQNRQGFLHDEAGGLLFATISPQSLHIVEATTPRPKDRRGGSFFEVDLASAQATINERHQHGLHYVGEWHTHPEYLPQPSDRDRKTIASAHVKSKHQLEALLMIIVGRKFAGKGLWVGLHNAKGSLRLCESDQSVSKGSNK